MKLQLERPLILFDLETTGIDPKQDRIVELAAMKIWPDGKIEEKTRRFNPGIGIPKAATLVHGIGDADVKNEPPFSNVARGSKGIAAFFEGCDLGGFNIIHFDIPILLAEFDRAGVEFNMKNVAVVDAYRIFSTKERRDLGGALKFYCNKEHDSAHTALGDVKATHAVLMAQLEKYADLPATPKEIDGATRDPDDVDRRKKLKWVDDLVTVNFGRNKGKSLKDIARNESDYIRWMIDNKVVDADGVQHLKDALLGYFATRSSDKSKAQ